jgi:hypothetical protein
MRGDPRGDEYDTLRNRANLQAFDPINPLSQVLFEAPEDDVEEKKEGSDDEEEEEGEEGKEGEEEKDGEEDKEEGEEGEKEEKKSADPSEEVAASVVADEGFKPISYASLNAVDGAEGGIPGGEGGAPTATEGQSATAPAIKTEIETETAAAAAAPTETPDTTDYSNLEAALVAFYLKHNPEKAGDAAAAVEK